MSKIGQWIIQREQNEDSSDRRRVEPSTQYDMVLFSRGCSVEGDRRHRNHTAAAVGYAAWLRHTGST